MSLEIHRLAPGSLQEESAWDRFVRASHSGTVFHLSSWRRVVEEVFGHTPHYLLAIEKDEICGCLPLFEIHGLLSGRIMVSVPYGVYGGICASDPSVRKALFEEAQRIALRYKIRHIELRQWCDPEPGLPTKSLYVRFAKPLDANLDANFASIPGKQRRWIRKGIKQGLEARRGWEFLAEFYDIYVASLRRLGSPSFPRPLFEAIRDHFESEVQLLTIWHAERPVAGLLSFFYKDCVMPYYGAALQEGFCLGVNDFMYWELMREACLAGYKVFDFGRSRKDSGSYDFKCHWGFEPQPLAYQYLLVNGKGIPNVSPSNPRFRLFIEAWKRLPLPLTKWLGPPLTKWLPLD